MKEIIREIINYFSPKSETPIPKKEYVSDRSSPEPTYSEAKGDRMAFDYVWKSIHDYWNQDGIVVDNAKAALKVKLQILEKDRDILFRSYRFQLMYWSDPRIKKTEPTEHDLKWIEKELAKLSKQKSENVIAIIDTSSASPCKYLQGQKVYVSCFAWCTATIVKRIDRREYRFAYTSDKKCWWYKIKVFQSLGDRNHSGYIDVPETDISDLKEHVEWENKRWNTESAKEQMNDPHQRSAGLRLQGALKMCEYFLSLK